jgi:threonine synthase
MFDLNLFRRVGARIELRSRVQSRYRDAVPELVCTACGQRTAPDPRRVRCACGGVVDLDGPPGITPVDLGAGSTPVVALPDPDLDVRLKLEGIAPTGSFKDRGAAMLVGFLAAHGVERAVADSSGNAGAAIAAHCARAGIALELYVPAAAAPGKLVQARAHGAEVVRIDGPRQAAADAAAAAVARGAVYASHAWSPYFLAGTASFADELPADGVPDALVLPVGSGTLLLGIWPRLAALPRPPRIYAIQSAACAPLATATGDEPAAVTPEPSAAEGVLVARPPRGAQALRAVRASGGRFLALPDTALGPALRRMAAAGVFAEPTSALGVAALAELRAAGDLQPGETVVCAVTGHGLKAPDLVASLLG